MKEHAILRRKCGCGGSCGPCDKEKRGLRRSAIDTRRCDDAVPQSVTRVLGSGGAPLDATVRRTLEPRFGHDFSSVRVHTGDEASRSAADVQARAWTVGNDIAFARGHYAPQTRGGLQLLAHELTHVVQQSSTPQTSGLTVGDAHDPAEAEADATAARVVSGESAEVAGAGRAAVRRFPLPPNIGDAIGIPGRIVRLMFTLFPAGRPLEKEEIKKAEDATGTKAPAAPAVPRGRVPTFILHDTSAMFSDKHITGHAAKHGPQGLGVPAIVPVKGDFTRTRPRMYETKRPTSTAWEKAADVMDQTTRFKAFRDLWKLTLATERTAAVNRALDNEGVDATELPILKKHVIKWLDGTPILDKDGKERDGVRTGASWAVDEIRSSIASAGATAVAVKGKDVELQKISDSLTKWFTTRAERVSSSVPVEIVQVGGKDPKGSPNTCDVSNPNTLPLPKPPYSADQYTAVTKLYLEAALQAGVFPFINTHRNIDKIIEGGHCDPRCFDLHKLYGLIAGKLGHHPKAQYGITPKYGTKSEHNVWWPKTMCHGDPPA